MSCLGKDLRKLGEETDRQEIASEKARWDVGIEVALFFYNAFVWLGVQLYMETESRWPEFGCCIAWNFMVLISAVRLIISMNAISETEYTVVKKNSISCGKNAGWGIVVIQITRIIFWTGMFWYYENWEY